MRAIGEDLLPPGLDAAQRTLNETLAERARDVGLAVDPPGRVVAEQPEQAAVELGEPTPDRYLPDRVMEELPADDADPHGLAGNGGRGHPLRWRVLAPDHGARERPEAALQVTIIPPLVGQVEGQRMEWKRREAAEVQGVSVSEKAVEPLAVGGPAAVDLRFVVVEHRQLGHAAHEPRVGVLGLQRQSAVEAGGGSLAIGRQEGDPEVEVRQRVPRLQRQRASEAGDRVGPAIESHERHALVRPGIDIGWLDRQRAIVAGEGLLVASKRLQSVPAMHQYDGRARRLLRREVDQLQSPGGIAFLALDHAEEVVCIDVARLRLENALVAALRLIELARLM